MELPNLTPTSVGDLDCAKRFWELRVLRHWPPRQPSHPAQEFSLAFHEVMRQVYDPRSPSLPRLDALETWCRAAFLARHYPDPLLRDRDMDRCQRLAKRYAEQDEDAAHTIDVERQGEFPIRWRGQPLFLLAARADRVIVRPEEPDRLVIRDYKLTQRRIRLEEAFLTLWAARLLYPQYANYSLELEWIDPGDGSVVRDVLEGAQVRGMHKLIMEKVVRVLTTPEHPAEPGEICAHCPLKPTCQPQIAVDGDGDIFEKEGR